MTAPRKTTKRKAKKKASKRVAKRKARKATSKPKAETRTLLSRQQYAHHRGLSLSRIGQLVRDGKIPLHDRKIDPAEADAILGPRRDQPDPAPPTPPTPAGPEEDIPADADRATAERLKAIWQARHERQKVMERTGQLVPRAEVEREAFAAARAVRDKLLVLPTRLRDALAAEDDPQKVADLLEQELLLALSDLAR